MNNYLLRIVIPMALSGFLFLLPECLYKSFRNQPESEQRKLLPLSNSYYLLISLTCGAISVAGYHIFNKIDPNKQAFNLGLFWLLFFLVLRWKRSKQMDEQTHNEQDRGFKVYFMPFVAGIWLTTAILYSITHID